MFLLKLSTWSRMERSPLLCVETRWWRLSIICCSKSLRHTFSTTNFSRKATASVCTVICSKSIKEASSVVTSPTRWTPSLLLSTLRMWDVEWRTAKVAFLRSLSTIPLCTTRLPSIRQRHVIITRSCYTSWHRSESAQAWSSQSCE